MGLLVNGAIGALAGVFGSLLGTVALGSKAAFPLGLVVAVLAFFVAGQVFPAPAVARSVDAISEWEKETAAKAAKKAKKAAAKKAEKEAAEAARLAELAAKAQEKAEKAKKKKKAKKAVVTSESESESEEEQSTPSPVAAEAPKSKSAQKKAAKKAKEAAAKAEAEKQAKAEAKKAKKAAKAAEKAGGQVAPAAAAPAAAAAQKAAPAPVDDDEEGWETIEPSRFSKLHAAKTSESQGKKKKQVTESIPASERPLTIDLHIPIKHHPLIIGSKGATLNLLQSGTNTEIDMPKRESGSSKIQITGRPADVAQAKNAIESLVERGFSHITHPGTLSDDITVDPKDIGLILGANGSTLKLIQSKTSTRINLPEKGSSSKKVTIVGEKEGVKLAKATLRSLLTDGFSPLTHEGWTKLEMEVPPEKFGIVIGPKGHHIKSIQGNTKTRINLPERNSGSNRISIVGLPAGVAQAEKEINRLLEPPAPLPEPEEEDLATDDAWGQEHTAQGEDALWD